MTADTNQNLADHAQDAALIERIRTGDRTAFMAFYDRFSPLLFSVAAIKRPRTYCRKSCW
jgi:hypothetical protein